MNLSQFLELVALPAFGGVCWLIWSIRGEIRQDMTRHREATDEELTRVLRELEALRQQTSQWQLEVVRGYATKSELERLESRIVGAIERLEAKFDKYLAATARAPDEV